MTIKILSTLLIATTLASDAFTKDIATLWTIGEKDDRGDKFVIKARMHPGRTSTFRAPFSTAKDLTDSRFRLQNC